MVFFFYSIFYFGAETYYTPSIGRWLNVDPDVEKYQSWNAYQYTFNDPLKYIDPDGRGPWPTLGGIGLRLLGIGSKSSKASSLSSLYAYGWSIETAVNIGSTLLGFSIFIDLLPHKAMEVPEICVDTHLVFPGINDEAKFFQPGMTVAPQDSPVLVDGAVNLEPFTGGMSTDHLKFPPILLAGMIRVDANDEAFMEVARDLAEHGIILVPSEDVVRTQLAPMARVDDPQIFLGPRAPTLQDLIIPKYPDLFYILLPAGAEFAKEYFDGVLLEIYSRKGMLWEMSNLFGQSGLSAEEAMRVMKYFDSTKQ